MLTPYLHCPTDAAGQPMAAVLAALMTVILAVSAWGADLGTYRWKYRLLLVMAPSASDPRLTAFEKRLSVRAEDVRDRDLLTLRLLETVPSGPAEHRISPEDVEALRRRYRAAPGGFAVILIGKDGGVKLVQDERVSLQAIFDLIDTMPMRRREMQPKGTGGQGVSGG